MEKEPLIDNEFEPSDAENQVKDEFIRMVSRGGLLKPSDTLYHLCCHARALYLKLTETDETKKLLISSTTNPRSAYVEVLSRKLEISGNTADLIKIECKKGHAINTHLKKLGTIMFNLFAKNLVNEENSKIQASKKRGSHGKTLHGSKLRKVSSN